ncbi:MAG: hypothetical protein M0T80_08495 [Actinomycetota bacterium]|nr:hypothetical protein [Actinomycetota bacterium]
MLVDVEAGVDDVELDDWTGRSVVEGDAEPLAPPQAASTDPATTRQAATPAEGYQWLRGASDRSRRARSWLAVSLAPAVMPTCGLPPLVELSIM